MTPDTPFLADILADPDSDGPRLIYADWLEDGGQAERAEFIRLQCQAARRADGPEVETLRDRALDLLRGHWDEWVGPLVRVLGPDLVRWGNRWGVGCKPDSLRWFPRGLLEQAGLTARSFIDRPAALYDLAPIRTLLLWQSVGVGPELAKCPHLAALRTISSQDYWQTPLDGPTLRALAGSPFLGHLRHLHLPYNHAGDAGMEALADAPWLVQLLSLDLDDNGIGGPGMRALARVPSPGSLTELDLASNPIGDEGAEALANAPLLSGLTRLCLRDCQVTGAGVEALARSPYLNNLTALNLKANALGVRGAAALAQAPWLERLDTLVLSYCELGDEGVEVLAGSPRLAGLTMLDLCGNGLGERAFRALAASPYLESLTDLGWEDNPASGPGTAILRASPYLANFFRSFS